MVHYPVAPHRQAAYQDHRIDPRAFPITERLQNEVLSVPMHPHMTDAETGAVALALNAIAKAGPSRRGEIV
jgi:dTDP-4-amino-4,6-dideoxygalactose transaminase